MSVDLGISSNSRRSRYSINKRAIASILSDHKFSNNRFVPPGNSSDKDCLHSRSCSIVNDGVFSGSERLQITVLGQLSPEI